MATNIEPYLTTTHGVLYQADCLRVLGSLDDETVDTVFADPPFNLGKDYGKGVDDSLMDEDYLSWTNEWLAESVRVLKPGGALFFYNIPRWCIPIGEALTSRHGMTFRHWIALTMKNTYPRGNGLYPAHYGLLYFTKGSPRTFNKLRVPIPTCRHCGRELRDYGGHRDKLNPRGLNLTDFWEDTSPVRHRKFKNRPANELKPMIPERAILMSTDPGDLVLDPFGGGGSTYQMAEQRHRRWLGTEIGDCAPIAERLAESGSTITLEPDRGLSPTDWVNALQTGYEGHQPPRPGDEVGEAPLISANGAKRRRSPNQGSFLGA